MNIFRKIAILHHINKNKDNVTYGYRYDIGNSAGLHKVEIRNHGKVSIQMNRDYWGNTSFYLEYNLKCADIYTIPPCQQSYFDELFIGKMYSKMFNNYVAKKGVPTDSIRQKQYV